MPKLRTTVTLDERVLRAVRVKAARTGKRDSEVIEGALRRDLGLELLERIWERADADEDEALRVAEVVPDPEAPPPIRAADPDDDCLLALGARENVPVVSGDGHLVALADRGPVMTPREFADRLAREL